MFVLNTPRRITLYWLLLLLPALAVGTGAIVLLRREQARLAERSAVADEARRAAVEGRARLIVENIELLVSDVQNGLLDTLATENAGEVDAFLDQLPKTNPLVRTAFRASANGSFLWPNPRTASEDARGFQRRFARQFGERPPWLAPVVAQKVTNEKREQELAVNESAARQEVSKNVAQWQGARRDVQQIFKDSNASNQIYAQNEVAQAAQTPAPAGSAGLLDGTRARGSNAAAPAGAANAPAESQRRVAVGGSFFPSDVAKAQRPAPTPAAQLKTKDAAVDRSGWTPTIIDGQLHIIAWLQPGGTGDVRGVELQLNELISRLGGALPAELPGGEGYAIRDAQARTVHQVGELPKSNAFASYERRLGAPAPLISVPLSAALLPGWRVDAFLTRAYESANGGTGFFWLSALLVTIFVAAILLGGALLLWQARRSEEEAAQKTSFVANVSHEFKTPLTTIRLYSELLEQGRVRDSGQAGEYLRTIGRETQRLARLVNNALDFSRLEQGRKKYAREEIDLGAELSRLLETHAPRVAEAGLELRRDLPAAPVKVKTDRDAIEQIVLNLIDNACKYASEGGEVSVVVIACGDHGAEVRVRDRGPGVPEEHHERIFEKFHRVDDKLTAEKTGAGLGLSIARQLARGLGGELRYVPREGGGAEFILELP